MSAEGKLPLRRAGSLGPQSALIVVALISCAVNIESAVALGDTASGAVQELWTGHVAAAKDQYELRRPPLPPQEAFEACDGKKQGDTCSFISPEGILNGECVAEFQDRLDCRPHRAPLPTESAPLQSPPAVLYDRLRRYAGDLGYYLVVAVIAAGLTWYGFFRHFTLPLRRLRKVTRHLAAGDLSARVGEGLNRRRDEVAELGRDVDLMAERIEGLVGAHQRLIRDVSHELRSPLARLNVALELARQSAGPAHSAPFDRIERESDRLNELISQLLMLTKLENEGSTIRRTDLDKGALVGEVAQDVDFEAKGNERGVVTAAYEPLLLIGNRELLRQALENLVRNAARYTATGTKVEISLSTKESGGRGWAHIEIRDYGPGVPESELSNIFRPFYRIGDARERQSGGAGVGLAIADRAVRLHGGSLRACNAPGGGLIMEMDLPLT
jgi:two-component system sensor histidine kinase CpxA